jgi:[glutamine synthetase] adenylyltransferase / [glutamine synthetase]-adenylyl-L-tyrosine phosphorylase
MTHFRLIEMLSEIPRPHNMDAVHAGLSNWRAAVAEQPIDTPSQQRLADVAEAIEREPGSKALLEAIFGNSLFLSQCVNRDPEFFCNLVCDGANDSAAAVLQDIAEKGKDALNNKQLMQAVRIAKRRMALAIAVADLGNVWDLDKITRKLSETADATLSTAAAHLIREATRMGAFELADREHPENGSGLIVIGMGKLGAFELNYSSDIDLIIFYDTDRISTANPDKLQNHMVRLARSLVRFMDERTADGYVFRTDLRLRPDPGATPLAVSVNAAETYYESLGQNWERAAMIKARPVAGDLEAGVAFLKHLTPFIWRKSLDFAAIQDIHSIKRQINAHQEGATAGAEGHNIKLGAGGIREIEFFAQTQQLIWGGREPGLRSPYTVQALQDLVAFGLCDQDVADDLTVSYRFLRRVEHRLQMINDEQTQTLPEGHEFDHLATFLGYDTADEFRDHVHHHLNRTQEHYSKLFASSPSLSAEGKGNLAFTGADSDPDTLKTIGSMGFHNPTRVDAAIRGWHHGRYRAVRSTRAREILTELLPSLLAAMSATPDPDTALLKFDEFLQGLPAGVQLFSMIQANPQLMTLLAEIMGMAPRLADHLSSRPAVLDSFLTPDFSQSLPSASEIKEELSQYLARAEYMEDVLNFSRRWAHDRRFQVGVQQLRGLIPPAEAATALSNIAEAVVDCLFKPVHVEFIETHGVIEGSDVAVLALGKLGSREMTTNSDLDLVIIYGAPADAAGSDGAKTLSVTQYFARLSQRLINALTALTPEGGLFEVDMRLRPSGNSGPIATTIEAFAAYHADQAWTWEHMALTRARIISATSNKIQSDVEDTIQRVLTNPRAPEPLLRDVADMRARLAREKPADCLWSLKQLRGGMVDIEFIAQYLALRHAAENPNILNSETLALLQNLTRAGYLNASSGALLGDALTMFQALQGTLSLTIEDEITSQRVDTFSDALKARLADVDKYADFNALEAKVTGTASRVFNLFQEIIDTPASQLPAPKPEPGA